MGHEGEGERRDLGFGDASEGGIHGSGAGGEGGKEKGHLCRRRLHRYHSIELKLGMEMAMAITRWPSIDCPHTSILNSVFLRDRARARTASLRVIIRRSKNSNVLRSSRTDGET